MTPGHEVLVVDSDVVSYLRLGKDRVAADWFRTETRDARPDLVVVHPSRRDDQRA